MVHTCTSTLTFTYPLLFYPLLFLYCETDKADNLYICICSDLWESDKFFYPWPTSDLTAIFRPFNLSDLESAINPTPVRKVVFVQVNQTYDETGNTKSFVIWIPLI